MGDLHEVLWGLAFRGGLDGGPPRSPLGAGSFPEIRKIDHPRSSKKITSYLITWHTM
jgi:hypothetical protein